MAGKPSTFQYDDELPDLPLPTLRATLGGLRRAVLALKPTQSQIEDFDKCAAEAEPQLKRAQDALQERERTLPNSYLGGWWDEYAYLRNRYPNVLNTNVFCVRDSDFDALGEPNPLSHDPVVRTALTARESLEFRRLVVKEQLPPEKFMGRHPMCMRQYRRYWTVRKPGLECDTIEGVEPRKARSIHIMHRGAMFFIDAIDAHDGSELNVAELIAVLRLGLSKLRPPPLNECVGSLTALPRTEWAKAWQHLEKLSGENKATLEGICHAVTTIALDDTPVTTLHEGINRAAHEHSHNRWFDRSSLRIVSSNGVVMEHGDHTAMDAIVMASTPVDYMAGNTKAFVQGGGLQKSQCREGFQAEKYLRMVRWELDDHIRKTIEGAQSQHAANCRHIEVDTYTYAGFGRDSLRHANTNADAFVQQALQLAFYRDRRKVTPVYETASTRLFKFGRTDTIRSLTVEQRQFVEAFDDPKVPKETKRKLFNRAMKAHAQLSMHASTGKGIDRHLMALRIAQQTLLQEPLPAIFSLPIVAQASNYQLLTSQMVGRHFVGGFCHVLPDGYGCCYYLRRNAICIVVAGCNVEGLTSVDRFQLNLTRTFHDLAAIGMDEAEVLPQPAEVLPAKL